MGSIRVFLGGIRAARAKFSVIRGYEMGGVTTT